MPLMASYSVSAPGAGGVASPSTSLSSEALQAAEEAGVVEAVERGLRRRVAAAQAAGVPSWNILLDPGLGFAKSPVHSFALLRNTGSFRRGDWLEAYWARLLPVGSDSRAPAALTASADHALPFPLLYGPSRKGFIGAAAVAAPAQSNGGQRTSVALPLDTEARDWGTAAAVTASIFVGADFVRVHNVGAMHTAVAVADAVHRGYHAPQVP
jgi:2-amino-4-hydroxy-6-hydroxymethyldihydropteridine diphosphokinase / dihydropteroate synthase